MLQGRQLYTGLLGDKPEPAYAGAAKELRLA